MASRILQLESRVAALEAAAATPSKKSKSVAGASAEAPAAPKKAGRPKKEPVAPLPLPEAEGDEAPSAASYRLDPASIDTSVCVARRFVSADKRWRPAVNREGQCGAVKAEGEDLCTGCLSRLAKYAEAPKRGAPWLGRVDEEPIEWCNMLDSAHMLAKPPKWLGAAGGSASASEASSDSGSAVEMPAPAAASKKAEKAASAAASAAAKKAEKEAAAAAKAAEKEAKKAEKEAEKAAKAAEKEAAAAAKKAEKEAAAAAKKAEKPAKAKKAADAAAKPAAAAVPAKADVAAPAAEAEGELKLIDGSMYIVRGRNVYEYNDLEEKAGAFCGRLNPDGESIDTDGAEEGAAESDSE